MSERLEKIADEIAKAKQRRAAIDEKIKELENKYREVRNTEIQDIVAKANLTPEALAILIERSRNALPQTENNYLEAINSAAAQKEGSDDEE
ncbi:DUF4315 family protein [Lachnospiraceae bacterium C1.1]|nr:DUF4315 family protein [Lachnospiraceae bacterium C1.1]